MNLHTYRIAFTTIVVKEIRRFSRIWIQTILPPMITTALYFVIFGKMIGSQIAPIDGFSFSQKDGTAIWDRTALVAGGRERVVIDDALPPEASVESKILAPLMRSISSRSAIFIPNLRSGLSEP